MSSADAANSREREHRSLRRWYPAISMVLVPETLVPVLVGMPLGYRPDGPALDDGADHSLELSQRSLGSMSSWTSPGTSLVRYVINSPSGVTSNSISTFFVSPTSSSSACCPAGAR